MKNKSGFIDILILIILKIIFISCIC